MLLGAHVSVAGGLAMGPSNGVALGCDVIQVFTRNQRQWTHKPVTDEEADAFKQSLGASGLKGVMAHASYLMNLASPKRDVWAKSLKAAHEEAARCEALGIDRFVFHPGAHIDSTLEEGRTRIAKALRQVLDDSQASRVRILLETMAGQGTTIGNDFVDLAAIIDQAGADKRLGVCVDTCHVFAAGNDVSTHAGYEQTIKKLDDAVGLKRIHAFHLNDSKLACGQRRDRHAIIGDGMIGLEGFRPLMNDARFEMVPMALETPGGDDGYRLGLQRLRSLIEA